jgi:hypothetical protein
VTNRKQPSNNAGKHPILLSFCLGIKMWCLRGKKRRKTTLHPCCGFTLASYISIDPLGEYPGGSSHRASVRNPRSRRSDSHRTTHGRDRQGILHFFCEPRFSHPEHSATPHLALEWGGQAYHWARTPSNLQPRVGGHIHTDVAYLNGPT